MQMTTKPRLLQYVEFLLHCTSMDTIIFEKKV